MGTVNRWWVGRALPRRPNIRAEQQFRPTWFMERNGSNKRQVPSPIGFLFEDEGRGQWRSCP